MFLSSLCAVRFAINWLENSRHSWDYAKSVPFPKAHANSEGILHPWRSCSLSCCLPGMEKPFHVYLAPHRDTLSTTKGTVRICLLCWHAKVPEKNRLNGRMTLAPDIKGFGPRSVTSSAIWGLAITRHQCASQETAHGRVTLLIPHWPGKREMGRGEIPKIPLQATTLVT